jgi:DNA-binding NtrC family response regulator
MRVDIDDLRRDFEAWQSEPGGSDATALGFLSDRTRPAGGRVIDVWQDDAPVDVDVEPSGDGDVEGASGADEQGSASWSQAAGDDRIDDGVVVFRPGMTMEDLEREAIRAALESVGGNRRRASELLEIGERTLYRKIKKFGLDEL